MIRAYRGSPALSGFRATRLLRQVQLAYPSVGGIAAEDVYFVQGEESFSAADEKILQGLLGCPPVLSATPPGVMNLVIPRPGTVSPWSSRATDIASNSGLSVKRVERGIAYYVEYLDATLRFVSRRMSS